MKSEYVSYFNVNIDNGFWKKRQDINTLSTIPQVYRQFEATDRFKSIAPVWKAPFAHSHFFFDSDTAKWIEAASYVLQKDRYQYPELEIKCDKIIDKFARLQASTGYVNSYYQRYFLPKFRFRCNHELYCFGHLAEASIAYHKATGKGMLLNVVEKYYDYIEERFIIKKNTGFVTPGHEEIELALYKLYAYTKDERYKKGAEFFLEKRGRVQEKTYADYHNNYDQHDKPIRGLDSAEGHAVRAMYLYCGMADMAMVNNDKGLLKVCEKLFDDIQTKMYITGGIGSSYQGEAFTVPYDIPNQTAYSESCAGIGLLLFCKRMLKATGKGKYAEIIEKVMYNVLLSGVSLTGDAFFYENPLEIRLMSFIRHNSVTRPKVRLPITRRQEVFRCSCCPPNIAREIASVGELALTENDDTVFVQQYIGCEANLSDKGIIKITTSYPACGKVKMELKDFSKRLAIRIPSWCEKYLLTVNGKEVTKSAKDGYVTIDTKNVTMVEIDFAMTPKFVYCNPKSQDNRGKVCIMRGPVVYCIEGVDNGKVIENISVDTTKELFTKESDLTMLPNIIAQGKRYTANEMYFDKEVGFDEIELTYIPYYAFANREETDMKVWVPYTL